MQLRPNAIYYEPDSIHYPLGKQLLETYKDIPQFEIENHNAIPEMRQKENKEFPKMKRNLIIGIRKTHRYVENHKVSDFLVPYTSSGCMAMCMYCYLVCNYNKCAYLRLFVNREQMLDKIIRTANKSEKDLVFEIGSNSDLILENAITQNLVWTIEHFADTPKGKLTFPTKFHQVQDILPLPHKGKVIVRMSVNPQELITQVEFGTSSLQERIEAINQLVDADYPVGILLAPIMLVDNWQPLYADCIRFLAEHLSEKAKKQVFFELIFMTYSYIHDKINTEAFPNAMRLYDKEKMTMRGKGKYRYKETEKAEAAKWFVQELGTYFPTQNILYIV